MRRGRPGHATTMRRASLASSRWLSLAVAVAVGLICAAAAGADGAPRQKAGAKAVGPAAGHGPFAGRVAIRGDRRLYLECRGSGRPLVMLEAGSGNLASIWTVPPVGPGPAVLPAVARFTRVCAYDRPGTYCSAACLTTGTFPDTFSRSDPVAMPRTALDIMRDLRALLRAADAPRPFVLAGHSFGGMVARLYATISPRAVAGLVSVDAQTEDYTAALKRLLPPEVFAAGDPGPPNYPEAEILASDPSAAQMRQAQADTPLRPMPFVVLSHSRTIPNPFGAPPEFPIEAMESAFQDSQDMLAKLVPGAKHVIATRSGHYIQLDQPRLVTDAIRRVVRQVRRR
jgi:pimeloyl-ACP methyl ester carboxylesterase